MRRGAATGRALRECCRENNKTKQQQQQEKEKGKKTFPWPCTLFSTGMSSQPKLKEWETLGWNLPLFSTSTLPQPPSKTNRSWNFCFILSRQIDTTRRIVCPADGGRDSLRPFSLFSPTIWIRGHEDGRPRLAVYANCLRLHYIDELPLRSWRQNEWRPRGGYTHTHTREPTSLVSLSLFPVVTFRSAAGSGSSR